jgi:metallo-beta-lactamase family protein
MAMEKPKITFYSGVGSVTGANFLFEVAGKKILVDCGLVQGGEVFEDENRKAFGYDPSSIDMLFITHAHLDHVGRIPKLVKEGFKGVIYSTPETRQLAALMLEDACSLLDRDSSRKGILPMYDMHDVTNSFGLWQTIQYHSPKEITPGLSVVLKDAGHILGSTMYQFILVKGNDVVNFVFTGDLGNTPTPLLKDTEKITDADYLIMESVYGDRNHEPHSERREKLKKVINDNASRKGVLVIPAFSIERTQVILFEIDSLAQAHEIPSMPVFVDSPLATKVTDVYRQYAKDFNIRTQSRIEGGDNIFNFPRLKFTMSGQDSRAIENTPNPKIIIAGSGMSSGGRVTHHEMRYLPDPSSTILLVGYQSVGTLGRKIQDGAKRVDINGTEVPVKAHLETIWGYSSHKDSDHLVEFVADTTKTLKKVFVVMGEPKASMFLAQKLKDNLGVNAIMPEQGKGYELN